MSLSPSFYNVDPGKLSSPRHLVSALGFFCLPFAAADRLTSPDFPPSDVSDYHGFPSEELYPLLAFLTPKLMVAVCRYGAGLFHEYLPSLLA